MGVTPESLCDGEVVCRTDESYNKSRSVFNGMIDRYPSRILYPESLDSLINLTRCILSQDLSFSIRAGGHNVAGTSLVDDGYVVDTSRMSQVRVDRKRRIACVQPGSLWRDFDSTCAKYGLCTPGGIISDTGVAGLTLGGGIGWLNGLYGLSCDNLASARVLLANGELVKASDEENSDLMWALRGGGGNFGLVTEFSFNLHPMPELYAGSIVTGAEDLESAWIRYVSACRSAPREVTASFVAFSGPGNPRISLDVCVAEMSDRSAVLSAAFEPDSSTPVLRDSRQRYSYVNWQRQFDDDRRRGRRSYWRSIYLPTPDDPKLVGIIKEYLWSAPSEHTMLTVDHIHGAAHQDHGERSCFGDRNHEFLFLINTNWDSADDDRVNLEWSDSLFRELTKYGPTGTYVNYLSREGNDRATAAYGRHVQRLRDLKSKYDPRNMFRVNQNITPA